MTKPRQIEYTEQNILNNTYDKDYDVMQVEPLGYDGQTLQRMQADALQIKTANDGTYDYFCFSAPGTALASALWQVFRIDGDGNKMYADADANFDNVASDPTALSYSYS